MFSAVAVSRLVCGERVSLPAAAELADGADADAEADEDDECDDADLLPDAVLESPVTVLAVLGARGAPYHLMLLLMMNVMMQNACQERH